MLISLGDLLVFGLNWQKKSRSVADIERRGIPENDWHQAMPVLVPAEGLQLLEWPLVGSEGQMLNRSRTVRSCQLLVFVPSPRSVAWIELRSAVCEVNVWLS